MSNRYIATNLEKKYHNPADHKRGMNTQLVKLPKPTTAIKKLPDFRLLTDEDEITKKILATLRATLAACNTGLNLNCMDIILEYFVGHMEWHQLSDIKRDINNVMIAKKFPDQIAATASYIELQKTVLTITINSKPKIWDKTVDVQLYHSAELIYDRTSHIVWRPHTTHNVGSGFLKDVFEENLKNMHVLEAYVWGMSDAAYQTSLPIFYPYASDDRLYTSDEAQGKSAAKIRLRDFNDVINNMCITMRERPAQNYLRVVLHACYFPHYDFADAANKLKSATIHAAVKTLLSYVSSELDKNYLQKFLDAQTDISTQLQHYLDQYIRDADLCNLLSRMLKGETCQLEINVVEIRRRHEWGSVIQCAEHPVYARLIALGNDAGEHYQFSSQLDSQDQFREWCKIFLSGKTPPSVVALDVAASYPDTNIKTTSQLHIIERDCTFYLRLDAWIYPADTRIQYHLKTSAHAIDVDLKIPENARLSAPDCQLRPWYFPRFAEDRLLRGQVFVDVPDVFQQIVDWIDRAEEQYIFRRESRSLRQLWSDFEREGLSLGAPEYDLFIEKVRTVRREMVCRFDPSQHRFHDTRLCEVYFKNYALLTRETKSSPSNEFDALLKKLHDACVAREILLKDGTKYVLATVPTIGCRIALDGIARTIFWSETSSVFVLRDCLVQTPISQRHYFVDWVKYVMTYYSSAGHFAALFHLPEDKEILQFIASCFEKTLSSHQSDIAFNLVSRLYGGNKQANKPQEVARTLARVPHNTKQLTDVLLQHWTMPAEFKESKAKYYAELLHYCLIEEGTSATTDFFRKILSVLNGVSTKRQAALEKIYLRLIVLLESNEELIKIKEQAQIFLVDMYCEIRTSINGSGSDLADKLQKILSCVFELDLPSKFSGVVSTRTLHDVSECNSAIKQLRHKLSDCGGDRFYKAAFRNDEEELRALALAINKQIYFLRVQDGQRGYAAWFSQPPRQKEIDELVSLLHRHHLYPVQDGNDDLFEVAIKTKQVPEHKR